MWCVILKIGYLLGMVNRMSIGISDFHYKYSIWKVYFGNIVQIVYSDQL